MTTEELRELVIGKSKAEVEAQMGPPQARDLWQSRAEPQGVNEAELNAFRDEELHEIWVYRAGRISFSVSGIVRDVDDQIQHYLPPERPAVS